MATESVSVGQNRGSQHGSRLFGQYIVKNRFQFKFSIILFFILAVSTAILWLESHIAVKQLIESGAVTGEDAILQLQLLSGIIGKTGFLILGITFGVTLFLSHFVAGPLYRIEKTFEAMQGGDLSMYVRLRKNDELQDSVNLLNQALAALRNKIKKEREGVTTSIGKIHTFSTELRKAGRNAEADQLDKLIVELQSLPPQIKIG